MIFSFDDHAALVAAPTPGPRIILAEHDGKIHIREGQGVKVLRDHHFPRCGAAAGQGADAIPQGIRQP